MLFQHLLLAALWILYCALHSLLASKGTKKQAQMLTGKGYRYYRLFYTIFAAVALAALVWYQSTISSPRLFQATAMTYIAGGIVSFTGIYLMVLCIKKYFLSLSGVKSLFQERPSAELMVTGIHRYMRHPLYTGTFLAIWGAWLVAPTLGLLVADVVITAYTLFAIRLEEEKLVTEFGDQYRLYQQRVPKLIPRF